MGGGGGGRYHRDGRGGGRPSRRRGRRGVTTATAMGDGVRDDRDDDAHGDGVAVERFVERTRDARAASSSVTSPSSSFGFGFVRFGFARDAMREYSAVDARGAAFERARCVARVDGSGGNAEAPTVYVIPGNPGVPGFYETYARELWGAFDGARTIEVIGYVGHTRGEYGCRAWFTLEEQKAHVRAYIARCRRRRGGDDDAVMSSAPPPPAVIVGHSIGAHLALDAMRHLGTDAVDVVVGLMPFLSVNVKSPTQSALNFITRLAPLVHAVGKVMDMLRVVAPRVRAALLSPITSVMDVAARDVARAWLGWRGLVNMAFMGRTEFVALRTAVDECPLIAHASGRCAFVYASDDHWAPLHQSDALKRLTTLDVDIHVLDDDASSTRISHDFVTSDAASRVMAEHTARLIRQRERAVRAATVPS